MAQSATREPPKLYAVTPEQLSGAALFEAVAAVLRGGAQLVQYRAKSKSVQTRMDEATALQALCQAANARFIVNDDPALALAIKADGVHLGESDPGIREARKLLGPKSLIGVSCYNNLERARRAKAEGASYLAFGAMFESSVKPEARKAPLHLLFEARRLALPVCAIGGITVSHAAQLVRAGADWLAVITDLFQVHDPETQARCFVRAMQAPAGDP